MKTLETLSPRQQVLFALLVNIFKTLRVPPDADVMEALANEIRMVQEVKPNVPLVRE